MLAIYLATGIAGGTVEPVDPATPGDPDYELIMPLDEAKRHMRVIGDDEDETIIELRNAAIDWVETYAGWALNARQFQQIENRFGPEIRLYMRPVLSVDAINYRGFDGEYLPVANGGWRLGDNSVVAASTWPSSVDGPGSVAVTYTAGAPNRKLVQAAKLAMTAMDEDRANPNFSGAMRMADSVRQQMV